MAWFLFIGDMLVMFFMVVLVVWVSAAASRDTIDYSARIPLDDECNGGAGLRGKTVSAEDGRDEC